MVLFPSFMVVSGSAELKLVVAIGAITVMMKMQAFGAKEITAMLLKSFILLLILAPFANSFRENPRSEKSHRAIQDNSESFSPQLSLQIKVHAFLFWASIGFLMPVGILVIRISNRVQSGKTLQILFYTHVIMQMIGVVLALLGVILSLKNFSNSFHNTHQRVGLVLYGSILIQPLIGFFRPQRGAKIRSIWYLIHWLLGIGICIMGVINIYIGLHALHARSSTSMKLWTVLFTAEICVLVLIYLLQEKWEYIHKQGDIISNDQNLINHLQLIRKM